MNSASISTAAKPPLILRIDDATRAPPDQFRAHEVLTRDRGGFRSWQIVRKTPARCGCLSN